MARSPDHPIPVRSFSCTCTFPPSGVSLAVRLMFANRRCALKEKWEQREALKKTLLVLLALFFFVFVLWAQNDQPPPQTPPPPPHPPPPPPPPPHHPHP